MKFSRIDLSAIAAISHEDGELGLLLDDGSEDMTYVTVPAPYEAYAGLQRVAAITDIALEEGCEDFSELLPESPEASGTEALPSDEIQIEMQPVRSAMARAIGYDRDSGELHVEFVSGATYRYEDVDEDTWEALQASESVGRFYNAAIRGLYACDRIERSV